MSAALVKTGEETVIKRLLENHNAEIARDTMAHLVQQSRRIDSLQKPLVHRSDLPADLAGAGVVAQRAEFDGDIPIGWEQAGAGGSVGVGAHGPEREVGVARRGVRRLAEVAFHVNENTENIGARRLHTVMERLLETVSFEASDKSGAHLQVTAGYVDDHLGELTQDEDLSRYIL